MKEIHYTIQDKLGLHARPAGLLVRTTATYKSQVTLCAKGQQVACNRLIALMGLLLKQGDSIVITLDGADEEQAHVAFTALLNENVV